MTISSNEKQRLKDHPDYEKLMREHVHLWEELEDGKYRCMLCDGNRDGYPNESGYPELS